MAEGVPLSRQKSVAALLLVVANQTSHDRDLCCSDLSFLELRPNRQPSWLVMAWLLPSQKVTMTGAAVARVPVRGGGG
ncbi:hypothetical protein CRG98_001298 [Punica granatum]|uniref:Uncharacterized protein n=1 Tax=Punica granatum TaxID=22663 RepID=A0A2I0LCE1_PUNGR|nr:hypothetical protein CRG98_001298 [Punica granatum]